MKKLLLLITLVVFYGATYGQRGVGIGVSSPTEKLHVVGNFRLEGAFKPGNAAGNTGQLLHSTGAATAPGWLPQGTTGQFLQSNGANALPTWVNAPQGGGTPLRPFGKVNYLARFETNDSTLGTKPGTPATGLTQDDGIQTLIRSTAGLPYADLNYLSIIEATNSGTGVVNNQRMGLRVVSQDSIAIWGVSSLATSRGSAIRGQTFSTLNTTSGLQGFAGSGSASQFTHGVWGQTSATPAAMGFGGTGLYTSAGTYGISNQNGLTHGVVGFGVGDQPLIAGVYGEILPLNVLQSGQLPNNLAQAGVIGLASISGATFSPQSGVWGIADTYDDSDPTVMGGAGMGARATTLGGAGIGLLATAVRAGDPTLKNIAANYGIWAEAQATEAESAGLRGLIYKTLNNGVPEGTGVNGDGFGVWGESYQETDSSAGVRGDSYATSGGIGVYGVSQRRIGVIGFHSATTGSDPGVLGYSNSTVVGASGVKGTVIDGETYGVFGETQSSTINSSGVYGYASAPSGQVNGVTGATEADMDNAAGIVGTANSTGTRATMGVYGETNSKGAGIGVYGIASQATGTGGIGVLGYSVASGAASFGVSGHINSADVTSAGVFGDDNVAGPTSSTSWAGLFYGNVKVTGEVAVTGDVRGDSIVGISATSGVKNFLIDHPLDPENKYLRHSCIESNERLNVYSGNVTTDANGVAIIRMPDYFQALNIDFRYQLTTIGQFANAIVSKKLENNVFEIKTDKPTVEVSWQISGRRNDPLVHAIPLVVEQNKEPQNRGKYLYPVAYKQPESKRIGYLALPNVSPSSKARDLKVSIPPKAAVKKVDPTQGSSIRKPNTTAIEVRKYNEETLRLFKERKAQAGNKKLSKEEMLKRMENLQAKPVKE